MRSMIRMTALAGAMALAAVAMPAQADDTVTAYNPGGMAKTLRDAGIKADLDVDSYGDPIINTQFGSFTGSIYFYGCSAANHDRCESVQFRTGLDRKKPMPLSLLNQVVKKYRYTAMWLDDEGDPWVNFDMFVGEGVPKSVFMGAFKGYSDTLSDVSDMVFAEERGK